MLQSLHGPYEVSGVEIAGLIGENNVANLVSGSSN